MLKINSDFKYLILVWIVLLATIILTYAHHGSLLIDCGREVYYPTQILIGKILYKDLFNIYGPFAYQFNALLFKIFGINLNVLYLSGCFCSFSISTLIYLISKRFLPAFLSFAISIFTISVGVLNTNLFNFIFPYSYGMLYGITAFLMSFFILLKYQEKPQNTVFLYISCFFAGLCILNKYEFFPFLFVVLYAILKFKKLNLKEYYYTIFSLLFMPIFCFGVLFIQGLRIRDLTSMLILFVKIAHCKTLKYFYLTQGVYFTPQIFKVLPRIFIQTALSLSLFVYAFKIRNKILSIFTISLSIIVICLVTSPAMFVFMPILILILFVFNFKKLIKNEKLMILVISGITISLKSFWGLATLNYGVFFVSFLIITLLALLGEIFKTKEIKWNLFGVYILIVSFILGYFNILKLGYKNALLKTSRGNIYNARIHTNATQELIDYIQNNTKKNDAIVILPEGTFINFLTDRKSDNYYNSLIPLYIETFGEDKIVKHFAQTRPEYIIFNNWDTGDYYFHYICQDYALSFCTYVVKNYTREKTIDTGFRYLIFKKNNN